MLKFIAKLFGSKSEKDIKRVMPLVEQTKRAGEALVSLSRDALRDQTRQVESCIADALRPIDEQIAALHKQIENQPEMDLHEKEAIFQQIDALGVTRNKELEAVLMEVLPPGVRDRSGNRAKVQRESVPRSHGIRTRHSFCRAV